LDSPLLPHGVLWDTPDFDSIDSAVYREGVIRAMALADIVILVVSKKNMQINQFGHYCLRLSPASATVICLNKLSEGSEALLIESLKKNGGLPEKMSFLK